MEIKRNTVLSVLEREAYNKHDISEGKWTLVEQGLHCYTNHFSLDTTKVAAFDLDHTLITPKSSSKFPKDANDWKFMYAEVPAMLKRLSISGYNIVIFTNQRNIDLYGERMSHFKRKIRDIFSHVK